MQIEYLKSTPKLLVAPMRFGLLILALWIAPQFSFATQLRTLSVELSFDDQAMPGKIPAGYHLYQDNVLVCETNEPTATVITCEFMTEDGTHTYELAAKYADNTESPKSPPFKLTIGDLVGSSPPAVPPPPDAKGSKLISYTWEMTTADSSITGYRMYLNNTALCETTDQAATNLSCYADLINAPMAFSIASLDASNTPSLKSNFLTLDPADFPALFQKMSLTFTWEYIDPTSSAGGFQVFNNSVPLCNTPDPTALSLTCEVETLSSVNAFTIAARNALGELTLLSNAITYIETATSPGPSPSEELVAKISASPASGPAPLNTSFSSVGSTGNIATYNWYFGDGDKGTGNTVTHTYATPGTYSAILEISDALGNVSTAFTTITTELPATQPIPPTAVISSSTAAGEIPLSVNFDGSASTSTNSFIASYNWSFGDGSTGNGQTISHVFTVAGTYNIQLLVADSLGLSNTATTPVIVTSATIANKEPIAAFTVSPAQGPYPLIVTFDASTSNDPDGSVANYIWNFGDGSMGSGKTAQHTYTSAATYTASLQVTDNLGKTSQTVTKSIIAEESQLQFNYELGELKLNHEWRMVKFANTFSNPVVFLSPPSYVDKDPVVTRVRNLTKQGFEVRIQEWDYLDGKHMYETVNYLAVEQGQTTLSDGTQIEAGTFNGTIKKQTVSFKHAFASTPVILTSILTENETDAITGRLSSVTPANFAYLFQEQESTKSKHVGETVGYLAWSQGVGTINNIKFSAVLPKITVTNDLTSTPFNQPWPEIPFLFSEMQTMNGWDPAALRINSLTSANVEMFAQEEQSKDSEVNHVGESFGYISFNTNP